MLLYRLSRERIIKFIPCHAKNEIQFNYTRRAGSTCTQSMFTTDSQSTNYRCVYEWVLFFAFIHFSRALLTFSIVPLAAAAVVYEWTIVFSGQTSGSTDFSINSSRCAQPPALPNNHQYFNLTFCAFCQSEKWFVCSIRAIALFCSPSHLPHLLSLTSRILFWIRRAASAVWCCLFELASIIYLCLFQSHWTTSATVTVTRHTGARENMHTFHY